MNKIFLLTLFIGIAICSAAFGGEFYFLPSFKCQPEVYEGPEATPQSPPLNVDDPDTPGCNAWEVNVLVDGDLTHSEKNWELPLLDINYGIGDNIQLKYEVPYIVSQSDGVSESAVGESKVGIKHMFFEDEELKLEVAVYPQLTFVTSNDAVKKGLVTSGTITTLPFLLSMKVGRVPHGDVRMTANLGYNISTKSDTADFVSAAVGVGVPLNRRLAIMGELSTEQAVTTNVENIREQLSKAVVGAIVTVSDRFMLFGSVGQSLYSSDHKDHTFVLAGIRIMAGGPKK